MKTPTNTSLVVVEFGNTVLIDCVSTDDNDENAIDYEWMKVNLNTGGTNSVSNNQTLTLSYFTSSTEDSGYYYCLGRETVFGISLVNVSDIILVVFAPVFVLHPNSALTALDNSIQFQCIAIGFPQPHIEWIRLDSNNNSVDSPVNSNISNSGNISIFSIDPVESDDFGLYHCITTPITSLPGNLSVVSGLNVSLQRSGASEFGSGEKSYGNVTPVLGSDLTDSSLENLTSSSSIAVLTGEQQ